MAFGGAKPGPVADGRDCGGAEPMTHYAPEMTGPSGGRIRVSERVFFGRRPRADGFDHADTDV